MLSPDLLLAAYQAGVFPMADDHGEVGWYAPEERGVLPLDAVHVPKSLRRVVRQGRFEVRTDTAFAEVVAACAASVPDRPETWISAEIARAYTALHALGFAHSVECWQDAGDGPALVGGLYGVALGGAFFGESMFHRATDASKVALVHLVERLRAGGFVLLDTQMTTPHLERFGVVEIPRAEYERRLAEALRVPARWGGGDDGAPSGRCGA